MFCVWIVKLLNGYLIIENSKVEKKNGKYGS